MMRALVLLVAAVLGGCATGTPPPQSPPAASPMAFEAELSAYRWALESVCQRSVPEDLVRRYEALVRAMDAGSYGYGRDGNFAGVRPPRLAYADCGD